MYVSEFNSINQISGPVLITGHTGFKGTWLTLMLEALGIPTCGYSLAPEERSLYSISNRKGIINESFSDIRDFESVNNFMRQTKPSLVIHLAAQSLVLESYNNPKLTFETNVLGTLNILESGFKSALGLSIDGDNRLKQNALVFSYTKDTDNNNTDGLLLGIKGSDKGLIFMGKGIDSVDRIKTVEEIVKELV
jgi:CDP-glucose 4,6-dehydratase